MIPAHWKLREWLTISEAARYLSSVIGERPQSAQGVGEADVLRLALDGHLKLSVSLPTGTKGCVSMERIEGLWNGWGLGNSRTSRADLPFISVEGITGAWVERAGVQRLVSIPRQSRGL